jgi:hypothetical protein
VDRDSGGKWRESVGDPVGFGGLKARVLGVVGDWDLVCEMGYRGHGDGALYACHAHLELPMGMGQFRQFF